MRRTLVEYYLASQRLPVSELLLRLVRRLFWIPDNLARPLIWASEVLPFANGLTGLGENSLLRYYNELRVAPFRDALDRLPKSTRGDCPKVFSKFGVDEALYVICRALYPKAVVETGVAHGISSTHILYALQQNGRGRLYSIDTPNWIYDSSFGKTQTPLPVGRRTGWFIPNDLRERWTLIPGLSREKLPPLLEQLREIDIFYHDSEHSRENMLCEYECAWSKIRGGGLLLSDDIDWSTAFREFTRARQGEWTKAATCLHYKLGGIRKK